MPCHHDHVGIIVWCYHDGCPMDLEPACADCGMRAEHEPTSEWERLTYFLMAQSPEHVVTVMKEFRTEGWAGLALDKAWDHDDDLTNYY